MRKNGSRARDMKMMRKACRMSVPPSDGVRSKRHWDAWFEPTLWKPNAPGRVGDDVVDLLGRRGHPLGRLARSAALPIAPQSSAISMSNFLAARLIRLWIFSASSAEYFSALPALLM